MKWLWMGLIAAGLGGCMGWSPYGGMPEEVQELKQDDTQRDDLPSQPGYKDEAQ